MGKLYLFSQISHGKTIPFPSDNVIIMVDIILTKIYFACTKSKCGNSIFMGAQVASLYHHKHMLHKQ